MQRIHPPADVWLDPRLHIDSSPIEGQGLFATDVIYAGEVVIRLGGRLETSAELNALIAAADQDPAGVYVDSITIYDDAHLVLPPRSAAHYGNHSCDPSGWLSGPYAVSARRNLHPGDELTLDYGTFSGANGFQMECRCRSPLCRSQVTSEDWRLADLRERYAGHWSPALEERIRTAVDPRL